MGTVKWERLRDKWALEAFGKPSCHSATYYCFIPFDFVAVAVGPLSPVPCLQRTSVYRTFMKHASDGLGLL